MHNGCLVSSIFFAMDSFTAYECLCEGNLSAINNGFSKSVLSHHDVVKWPILRKSGDYQISQE